MGAVTATNGATTVFGVYRNADLTEGRGGAVFVALFTNEAAAQEAALGIDVQGMNGVVRSLAVHDTFEDYFAEATGPERSVHLARLKSARSRLDALIKGAHDGPR